LREGIASSHAAERQAGDVARRGAHLPWVRKRVPVYAAASGPVALRAAGAVADGAFVNYGLGRDHVMHARTLIEAGAKEAGRPASDVDVWSIACLDVSERRGAALEKLGNILGFVAAYILDRIQGARRSPGWSRA